MNKLVNITGGIGSGKSSVSEFVKKMGFPVINSDEEAKRLMVEDQKLKSKITDRFGEDFYTEDSKVNTSLVSKLVFGKSKEAKKNLEALNKLVHPAVIDNNIQKVEELFEAGEELVFIESALTFEIGLEDGYDYIIVVDAPKETRIERVKKRSGLTEEQILERMDKQMSMEEKKGLADFTIDNSKDLNDLERSTEFIVSLVKDLPPKEPSN